MLEKGSPVSGKRANPGIEIARCLDRRNEGGEGIELDLRCFEEKPLHVLEMPKDGSGRHACALGNLLGRGTQGAVANTIDHRSGDGRARAL